MGGAGKYKQSGPIPKKKIWDKNRLKTTHQGAWNLTKAFLPESNTSAWNSAGPSSAALADAQKASNSAVDAFIGFKDSSVTARSRYLYDFKNVFDTYYIVFYCLIK